MRARFRQHSFLHVGREHRPAARRAFARLLLSSLHSSAFKLAMSAPLDLGALRREREARQASKKRERSISPPATSRKAPKVETSTTTLPSGARLTSFTSTVEAQQISRKPAAANDANKKLKAAVPRPANDTLATDHSPGSIVYPSGVVKKTWAFGHERDGNDIKLEEVLEPQTLRTAVLSAFQWDTEWILSKLKTPLRGGNTKCVFVMQAKEASLRTKMQDETQGLAAWLRLCFPPMEGQTHCMHSKLMLLFHPDKLRIAVPSANLLNFDWGETGVMENSVFMIDLPRLSGEPLRKDDLTDFGKELFFFLDKQGLGEDIKNGVLKFDFSATQRMAFVHSVGGISTGDDAQRSGLASLSRAVRQLNLQSDVSIDFAASSIGSLKDAQLSLLQAAACGEDVFEFSTKAGNTRAASFFKKPSPPNDHSIRDKFNIYFPTKETVQGSTAGAAGTICLSREWFEQMTFPRRCFRDYISTRPGLLSHNKIMYARSASDADKKVAWAYVGSANMSESAWGKVVFNKKDKTWQINCRNWECGVLLPVDDTSTSMSDLTVFDQVVRPPFLYPGPAYDGREPWYFKEVQQSLR